MKKQVFIFHTLMVAVTTAWFEAQSCLFGPLFVGAYGFHARKSWFHTAENTWGSVKSVALTVWWTARKFNRENTSWLTQRFVTKSCLVFHFETKWIVFEKETFLSVKVFTQQISVVYPLLNKHGNRNSKPCKKGNGISQVHRESTSICEGWLGIVGGE